MSIALSSWAATFVADCLGAPLRRGPRWFAALAGFAGLAAGCDRHARLLQVEARADYACALDDGRVRCWRQGQEPTAVPGVDDAVRISVDGSGACAVREDATAACWLAGESVPVDLGLVGVVDAIGVPDGWAPTCAVLDDGSVTCLGPNDRGQLGDGTHRDRDRFAPVHGLDDAASLTLVEGGGVCARTNAGGVSCWGDGANGALGDPATLEATTPLDMGLSGVVDVGGGQSFACALIGDGRVWCWGWGGYGQLGFACPDYACARAPTELFGVRDAVRLGVMYLGGCVLDPAGQAKCWGSPFGADSAARAMDLPWSSIDVSGGQNGAVFLAPDGGVHELTGG